MRAFVPAENSNVKTNRPTVNLTVLSRSNVVARMIREAHYTGDLYVATSIEPNVKTRRYGHAL